MSTRWIHVLSPGLCLTLKPVKQCFLSALKLDTFGISSSKIRNAQWVKSIHINTVISLIGGGDEEHISGGFPDEVFLRAKTSPEQGRRAVEQLVCVIPGMTRDSCQMRNIETEVIREERHLLSQSPSALCVALLTLLPYRLRSTSRPLARAGRTASPALFLCLYSLLCQGRKTLHPS